MTVADHIAALEAQRANLVRYHDDRRAEEDWHGLWDSAIDLAKIDAELRGLRFAEMQSDDFSDVEYPPHLVDLGLSPVKSQGRYPPRMGDRWRWCGESFTFMGETGHDAVSGKPCHSAVRPGGAKVKIIGDKADFQRYGSFEEPASKRKR